MTVYYSLRSQTVEANDTFKTEYQFLMPHLKADLHVAGSQDCYVQLLDWVKQILNCLVRE